MEKSELDILKKRAKLASDNHVLATKMYSDNPTSSNYTTLSATGSVCAEYIILFDKLGIESLD